MNKLKHKKPSFFEAVRGTITEIKETIVKGGEKIGKKINEITDNEKKQKKAVEEEMDKIIDALRNGRQIELPGKQKLKVTKRVSIEKQPLAAQEALLVCTPSSFVVLKGILRFFDGRDLCGPMSHRARKYSRFAAHSYGDLEDDVLPYGFRLVDSITTEENMKACTYVYGNEVVCAFVGSGRNIKDWENNITQIIGMSAQYDEALVYAKYIVNRYPDKSIVFVGHSKGGGEAAYCAYCLGMQAETFNPAALSVLTKRNAQYIDKAQINAYVFSTDILNAFQSLVGAEADGDVNYVPANVLKHGAHGILGILKYYKIQFTKKRKMKLL